MAREQGLLSWQYAHYPEGHRSRANLVIHAITSPMFALALLSLPASAAVGGVRAALSDLVVALVCFVAQARGHAGEAARPIPFESPWDFVARIVCEQLVTFPRFVLSGQFARAWRESGAAQG